MPKFRSYRGKAITIHFEGARCIHSRHCVLGQPNVFRPEARPWIQPEHATCAELVSVIERCPSGALTYARHDDGTAEHAPSTNVIRILENGPYAVHADLTIDGEELAYRATLCRCGVSKNKPFCDGSHAAAEFLATGEPVAREVDTSMDRGGQLKMRAIEDGPLKVEGNVEICSGTGRTVANTKQAFLCRCGASGSKPFCDGTHKTVKFKSD